MQDADGKIVCLYGDTRENLYDKESALRKKVEDTIFRREHPTVAEYGKKWLMMRSSIVQHNTLQGYFQAMKRYILPVLGDMYMTDVTADDIRLAMLPVAKMSAATYGTVNMIIKSMFYSAERSSLIEDNPAARISARGGARKRKRDALTDEQVKTLLDAIRDLPPYVFIMIGLYAGLRREEILALQWDCVFLDASTPYISVRRAWRNVHNRPDISTRLKTPAAKRDIPIPHCLAECLWEAKEKSNSEYVIASRDGGPLSESQFMNRWHHVRERSTKERAYYTYINGQGIRHPIKLELGESPANHNWIVCSIDFEVTPHVLRHTYITNLIYAGVDPKTVQYLAGHENSKVTMDIYAKVKYNKPEELGSVVNEALKKTYKV